MNSGEFKTNRISAKTTRVRNFSIYISISGKMSHSQRRLENCLSKLVQHTKISHIQFDINNGYLASIPGLHLSEFNP